jgi:polyhydroxyalkanoate synthesis repressor PhaR
VFILGRLALAACTATSRTFGMPERTVTIKRYDNLRLYNPAAGAYLSLEDIAAMVEDEEEFVVRDARTDEDVTRVVLHQIIRRQGVHG